MDDDLAGIALNSFEALEKAENEQGETNAQGSESAQDASDEQKGNNTNDDTENAPESELEGNNGDSNDAEDDEEEKETEDKEEGAENNENEEKDEKSDEESKEKEEMSDEEFEKLAKERGYFKKSEEDATKQRQKQDRDALASATKRPKEVDKETWESMPSINKVIYNQLPYITAVGKDGNTLRVKTPQQLPDDFEFSSKKAELAFQSDMQEQTLRAEQLNNQINQRIENLRKQDADMARARMIVDEVEALQKSGDLPTPKAKPRTKEFDNDEAVILTNKVLAYYDQRIANGDKMSIKDALVLYKAMNPDEFKSKKEAKGDSERKEIAKKISGTNKSSDTTTTKPNKTKYFRPGMDVRDIVDRALEDME